MLQNLGKSVIHDPLPFLRRIPLAGGWQISLPQFLTIVFDLTWRGGGGGGGGGGKGV